MKLFAQLSPEWRIMEDTYKGKFFCYVLERRIEDPRPSRSNWRAVCWPDKRSLLRYVQRHCMERVSTKRLVGTTVEFKEDGRIVCPPLWEVGHEYRNPGLDLCKIVSS